MLLQTSNNFVEKNTIYMLSHAQEYRSMLKKIIIVFFCLSVTTGLSGCLNTKTFQEEGTYLEGVESYSDEETPDIEIVEREPDFLLQKVTYHKPDGTIEGVLQYEYDLNGNELSNTKYNSDGTTEYRYVTEFNTDGKKVSCTNYDGNGIIKSVSLFDSNGNVIDETNYNLEGVLTTQFITTYDALGHRLTETFYNSDGEIMSRRIYEYEHDQLTHLQSYSRGSDGSLLLGVDTQYDSYGNVLRQRNPVWGYYTSYNYLSDTNGNIISKKGKRQTRIEKELAGGELQ